MLEGQSTNGGFAVDDMMFTPGACTSEYKKQETYVFLVHITSIMSNTFLARPERAAIGASATVKKS